MCDGRFIQNIARDICSDIKDVDCDKYATFNFDSHTFTSSLPESFCTMELHIKCIILLDVLVIVLASDEISKNSSVKTTEVHGTERKNNSPYLPLSLQNPGAIGANKDDSTQDSWPSSYKNKPQSAGDYPIFNEYSGNSQFNHLQNFPSNSPPFKGYPFPIPSWVSPDQMMQMTAAIKNMSDATKTEVNGLFSKLITDPIIAAVAFIPLSIVAAAIVPVLMNYMTGNAAPPMVSTTANNRGFRSFHESRNLEEIMENLARLARAMDSY
ncbi:uncharacterized protein NPIL_65591 [Nephila pilipes]|uniref:Uncharacterized protein n=1 Tax=Nephila pilipes TaxID=299642 RepID=A0A8X6ML72_NEPPI|nr:uncharacterized protein NPIL_65591 [Nephila pilipes]